MRKFPWMLPIVLLVAASASAPAHADGVDVLNGTGQVTAINGITLNGTIYNVTFTATIDNTFSAFPAQESGGVILGVANAINTALGTDTINDPTAVIYCIAAASSQAVCESFAPGTGWDGDFFIASDAFAANLIANDPGGYFWANFSPAVVSSPEPDTAALALVGLGMIAGLTWKRRQDAPRRPQTT
jgi:hypothetical protein